MTWTIATAALRLTNGRVRDFITRMQPREGSEVMVRRQDFDDLLAAVVRTAEWLQSLPPEAILDAELANEISDYRCSVERLHQILPAIHGRLLTQKARLEAARTHVVAAASWADASKGTL